MRRSSCNAVDVDVPTVVRGGIRDWPAFRKWNPAYLAATVGDANVSVVVSDTGIIRWKAEGGALDPGRQVYLPSVRFREAASCITDGKAGDPKYYINQVSIPDYLPELIFDLKLRIPPSEAITYLWFGSAGNVISLHYDNSDNIFAQIYGRKTFTFIDPAYTECVYPYPETSKMPHVSQVDLSNPDYDAFPRLRDVKSFTLTVDAGDLLLVPRGWWHYVVSDSVAISVSQWLM